MEAHNANIGDRLPRTNQTRPVRFRHPLGVMTGFAILFVVQISIAPFDFTLHRAAGFRWLAESSATPSLPDAITNIFLYVPLGFLLYWSISRRIRSAIGSWTAAVLLCGGLSFVLESIQSLLPSRISSLVDVGNNVMGAALGAGLAAFTRFLAPGMIGAAIEEMRRSAEMVAVKGYVVLLMIMAGLPFSFALDRGNLSASFKHAIFVPFGHSYCDDGACGNRVPADAGEFHQADMKRWSRWSAECASFALLAWLLRHALRVRHGFRGVGSAALTLWLGAILAFTLSAVQFIVVSRGFDATDILFRIIGLPMGIVLWSRMQRNASSTLMIDRTFARLGCAASAAYIIYNGTIPWRFRFDGSDVFARLSAANFIPFLPYFQTRADRVFIDVAEDLAMYAVFGALLRMHATLRESERAERSQGVLSVSPMAACALLSLCVEFVQVFIPSRFPGMTDPVLATAGGALGSFIFEQARSLYRFACQTAADRQEVEPVLRAPETPEAYLLGKIAEPHADAPRESVPSKSPQSTPHDALREGR